MMKKLALSILGAGIVMMSAPALAGEWKLNPRACPDLAEDRFDRIEDRRDRRFSYGRRDRAEDRRDRRENRRDRAVTLCPLRAFYYEPDRHEYRRAAHAGYRYDWRNARPPLQYDRRMVMYYLYTDGRKIYVRG